MAFKVLKADFIAGAANKAALPQGDGLPEVSVMGRSNVGKSSFINRLTGRRALARTSSTPGRTRQLNLFQLSVLGDGSTTHEFILVDVPGFGYAKFPKSEREALGELIVDYVNSREPLKLVLLLNDCRRLPERDELGIRDVAFASGTHVLVVLTKIDKLSKNERVKQVKAISQAYGLQPSDVMISGEKIDIAPVWERILSLLKDG